MEIVYLLKDEGKEDTYVKVGHTKDWESSRVLKYNTHNPNYQLCATIPVKNILMGRQIEWAYANLFGFRNSKNNTEWFKVDDDTLDNFVNIRTLSELLDYCDYYETTRQSVAHYRQKLADAPNKTMRKYYQGRLDTMIELLSY